MNIEKEKSKPKLSRILSIFLFAAGVSIIILFGFPRQSEDQQPRDPEETASLAIAPVEDSIAPDFSLINTQGERVKLSDFRGQPVLINFWATWCGPCRIEMPAIQDRFERHRDEGFVVLAVDFDEAQEDVATFGEELGLTFDLLLDPGGKIQDLYRVLGYPTSHFVDSNGVIKVQHIGIMTEGQLDNYLSQIGLES